MRKPRKQKFHADPKDLPQLLESAASLGHQAINDVLAEAAKWWNGFPKRIEKAVKVKT